MKPLPKFNADFRVGTKVLISEYWCKVTEIHESRQWIKVDKLEGSFQRADVLQYKRV
jgi:hypothetical protein